MKTRWFYPDFPVLEMFSVIELKHFARKAGLVPKRRKRQLIYQILQATADGHILARAEVTFGRERMEADS